MEISKSDKEYLLSLKSKDFTMSLIINLIGDRSKVVDGKVVTTKPRFKVNDTFTLNANEYINKEKVVTTVGRFIYNKIVIEPSVSEVTGYVNVTIDKKELSKLENLISKALLNDKITSEQMVAYLDRNQWLGLQFNSILATSFSENIVIPNKKIIKKRDELIKANKKALDEGDVTVAVKIENTVKDMAEKDLKDDYGVDLYASGGGGTFHNNYKAMALIKGPVYNPSTKKWDFVGNSLIEGIDKKDIPPMANSITTGAYPKAVGTQTSGYLSKQIIAAFQTSTLDKLGSDCGSKNFLPVEITKNNKSMYLYRYIIEGSKLVLLDDNNIDKYIGKIVKMRSPMYCISKKICRVCAGKMFEKLGIDNIGMSATRLSGRLLNINMKNFHDSTVSIHEFDSKKLKL